MPTYTITIAETGERYRCPDTSTLLAGMEALGKKGIPVGCRGGGCGVCKIEILAGTYSKRVMSREHVSEADEAAHRVLACRTRPTSDITLRVLGSMSKKVCRPAAALPIQGDAGRASLRPHPQRGGA
jgi:ferredoxin